MRQINNNYRQGDVLLVSIKKFPVGGRKVRASMVLAYGEVTGHSHKVAVASPSDAKVFDCGGGCYLQVSAEGVSLQHEEHGTVVVPPGRYQVRIQQEYSPEEIRNVAD